jgi:hypothetical protein
MSNILVLEQSLPAWSRWVVGMRSLQRLHSCHFIVANHEFALLCQFRRLLIQGVDGLAFDRECFIFGAIEPIATFMRVNGCFFLIASPHGEVRWLQQSFGG